MPEEMTAGRRSWEKEEKEKARKVKRARSGAKKDRMAKILGVNVRNGTVNYR